MKHNGALWHILSNNVKRWVTEVHKSWVARLLFHAVWVGFSMIVMSVHAKQIFYLSDAVKHPIYEQFSSGSRVVTRVPLNATLKVIEQSESGWSLVEFQGVRGWIKSDDLVISPNSSFQLALEKTDHQATRSQLYKAQKENRYLVEENQTMKAKTAQLQQENYLALYDLNRLKKLAEKPLMVDELNEQYRLKIKALSVENMALQQTLEVLTHQEEERVWWRIVGVLLLGLVLGWLIGVLKRA